MQIPGGSGVLKKREEKEKKTNNTLVSNLCIELRPEWLFLKELQIQ